MKKALLHFSAALLALLACSCFENEVVIEVNKDGSGKITEQTLLSAEASEQLEMVAAAGKDPLASMADPDLAKTMAAKMGEGVEVEKAEKIDKAGRKGTRVTYRFKDINELKYTPGAAMAEAAKSMAPPGLPEKEKKADKPITFKYEGGVLTLVNPGKPADGEKPEKAPEIDEQQLAMAQGMFKGMKTSLKVVFPDGIAESTASHVEGNTVTLAAIDFGVLAEDNKQLAKLIKLNEQGPAAVAEGFKDAKGVTVEAKDSITVKLK